MLLLFITLDPHISWRRPCLKDTVARHCNQCPWERQHTMTFSFTTCNVTQAQPGWLLLITVQQPTLNTKVYSRPSWPCIICFFTRKLKNISKVHGYHSIDAHIFWMMNTHTQCNHNICLCYRLCLIHLAQKSMNCMKLNPTSTMIVPSEYWN